MLFYAERFAGCEKSFLVLRTYELKSEAHCGIEHMLAVSLNTKGEKLYAYDYNRNFEHITHRFSPQVSRHVDSHFFFSQLLFIR